MVRDVRIKEFRFAETISATTTTSFHSDHGINGELLSVEWNFNRTGSIALSTSGTGFEFYRRNLPSGASFQQTQPRFFTESTIGSIANALHVPQNINEPIVLDVTGLASGTQVLEVTLKYR